MRAVTKVITQSNKWQKDLFSKTRHAAGKPDANTREIYERRAWPHCLVRSSSRRSPTRRTLTNHTTLAALPHLLCLFVGVYIVRRATFSPANPLYGVVTFVEYSTIWPTAFCLQLRSSRTRNSARNVFGLNRFSRGNATANRSTIVSGTAVAENDACHQQIRFVGFNFLRGEHGRDPEQSFCRSF